MARQPASIRFNNPGAQYPGPSARRFGSIGTQTIGGGHKIAVFDDPVAGAAAQFDLLNRAYSGMTLSDAIRKWSGGNSSEAYAQRISQATGIPMDAVLTKDMLANPAVAIPLAKTAADWEAGGSYPMTDAQWQSAFNMAAGNTNRGGSMNGGYGMSPTGAAGIAGPVQTSTPKDDVSALFNDFQFGLQPASAPSPQAPQGNGGGISLPFGFKLAGASGGDLPSIPQAQAPQSDPLDGVNWGGVDFSNLFALAQGKRKVGV